MTHGSLFSGIGGFDLAAEWMNWTNVFHCEKDDKARQVLHKRFPNTITHEDIYELDGTQYEGQIDIISGGFPCQPFSLAGKRKGRDDDRYLWPQMLRIIREIKPTYVVGENVFGLVNMEDGKTFDDIWSTLENEGYTVESFILPACAVQAWHRRDRVWIIAYSNEIEGSKETRRNAKDSDRIRCNSDKREKEPSKRRQRESSTGDLQRIHTDTDGKRLERNGQCRKNQRWQSAEGYFGSSGGTWTDWETEPGVGRVATRISNRVDRLRQLGNAIVPQVAYQIFKIIQQVEDTRNR